MYAPSSNTKEYLELKGKRKKGGRREKSKRKKKVETWIFSNIIPQLPNPKDGSLVNNKYYPTTFLLASHGSLLFESDDDNDPSPLSLENGVDSSGTVACT